MTAGITLGLLLWLCRIVAGLSRLVRFLVYGEWAEMGLFNDYRTWSTPDGTLWARIDSEYVGLKSQPRVVLVDTVGRVYHYDSDQVHPR